MTHGPRYTRTAISLHWLIALAIFFGWSIGLRISDMPPSPDKLLWVNWHKWIGVSIFTLAVLRVLWRSGHPAPALPPGMPRWQLAAAHVSHFMLYALVLAIPVTGWLMSSAKGFQTVWFGVVPLPDLLAKDRPLGEFLEEIHGLLAWTLAGIVALHVAAALKHHFVDRDDVLRRILPMLAAILLISATSGDAVNAARSRLTATFRQMSVPVEGQFGSFRGSVRFDPKHPAAAVASLEVDTASFDLGEPGYSDEVRKPEWFDSARYPHASFTSTTVSELGPGRYVALGKLRLKGRTADLRVPFALAENDGQRSFEGDFTLSRKAFDIGSNDWDGAVEDAVVVKFRILTTRKS